MIFFKNHLYEESFRYEDKMAGYVKIIRELILKSVHDKILRTNKKVLLSDIAKRYMQPISPELSDLNIMFINSNDYFYDNVGKTIILPNRILSSEFTKKDGIGISHELEHHFQFKNGTYKDQGTLSNKVNRNNGSAYNNDINEINARLSQISSYLKNSNKFREEVSQYDFAPFVEEVLIKVLYLDDPNEYLDEILTEDNRNKVLEYLYLLWKKINNDHGYQ